MTGLFVDKEEKEVAIRMEFYISGKFSSNRHFFPPLTYPDSRVIPKRQRGISWNMQEFKELAAQVSF
jgi:hypothetical protein